MVPKGGLEPPHPCEYMDLNHARLPIPPLRHARERHSKMLDTSTVSIECYKRWRYCQFGGLFYTDRGSLLYTGGAQRGIASDPPLSY
jgi:hypothetical protein